MQTMMTKLTDMQIGEQLFGFELFRKEQIQATGAILYMLRHVKTGAEVLISQRDCENKSFGICFETLPENHTGVFHILEHSVLNGSAKYPVKEPFVVLLQSSMQTFLNAMTFSDKTVYPVSSRNAQDFHNLMSVYMDAVFCPAIYQKPEIFQQEGWHYEMENADTAPTYNGVVFSEMKGAFSSVDSIIGEEAESILFPDTCYRFCSGGNPKYIPDLTYEEFINTHKRFYHPSNAKIFLDGDMESEPILQFIDEEYFSKYDYREKDFAMVEQIPVAVTKQVTYQPAPGEEDRAHLLLSKIMCKFDDYEKIYAMSVLCDYLTATNESPLQRVILEAGLGKEAEAVFNDGIYQPFVMFLVRNTTADKFDTICQTVKTAVADLLDKGLDKKALSASLERLAFRCREVEEPYGLMLGLKALDSWLYGGDPIAHWDTEPIFTALREKLSGNYFEILLQEAFGDPSTMCRLEILPSTTKMEEDAKAEGEKLQGIFNGWDQETREKVCADSAHLVQWQQTPDRPEDMARLPVLNLSDIPQTSPELKTDCQNVGGCEFVTTEVDTHGITYLNLYFSMADLTVEQLQTVKVMTMLLGELPTEHFTATQLQSEVKTWLGKFRSRVEVVSKTGDIQNATPYLVVSGSVLSENVQKGLDLIREILNHTLYNEPERIGEKLAQNDYALQQSLISSGHMYAISKAAAPFSVAGTLTEELEGETFVTWLHQFVESYATKQEPVLKTFESLHKAIVCKSRLVIGAGGELPTEALEGFLSCLPQGEIQGTANRKAEGKQIGKVEIPSTVNYCGIGHNLYAMGLSYTGSAAVLSSMMSYGYLWNAVRVQGGAYGAGMLVRNSGDIQCYSYRDPNPQATVNAFKGMADFLEGFCQSGSPLDSLIIGTVGQTEPLLSPGRACNLGLVRHLSGTTYADICKIRKEILTTTMEDFKKLIPVLRKMAQDGAVCVVGGKEALAFLD